MDKKNIALLFGGASTEHTISCKSVMSFINNADIGKYNTILIGITRDGTWYLYEDDVALIPTGKWAEAPLKKELFVSFGNEKGLFTMENGVRRSVAVDVFVPVLHGKNGEDGTIQGLFEMLGVPYVGCGVSASANSMDKSMTKLIVSHAGIEQADYILVDKHNKNDLENVADIAIDRLGFPLFIKPCASGSSIGICKAKDRAELLAGMRTALEHDTRVLIEKFINARELECAVLETADGFVAELGEVISADDFYDFDSKYNNAASITTTSPDLPKGIADEIRRQAIEIFKILDCRSLARVDFFLDKDTGKIIFNEINTMPGFTDISMYPMLISKCGHTITELIDRLIEAAL